MSRLKSTDSFWSIDQPKREMTTYEYRARGGPDVTDLKGGKMMDKEIVVTLIVTVRAILNDPEATDSTIRFLVEEDLRDKGWDTDVKL